ncbi:hypothetical protein [Streptomyces sp. cmx-18-6]|uniref:hypothetical protein n=1 Tax=Streptomyces sp. cmx-18-6 TaxID=2790930 RepID=UPI0039812DF2
MSKPIRMNRRTWAATWAVLCVAGLAATAGLKAASAPGPHPEKPVSAECREHVAYVEKQLEKARQKGEGEGEGEGILAYPRRGVDPVDCTDELRDLFRSER